MSKYWLASLEEISSQDGSIQPRKGFKEPEEKYATRQEFGEMCWEQCINAGFDRDSGDFQLRITGPIELGESGIDKAKRTLQKQGKTL